MCAEREAVVSVRPGHPRPEVADNVDNVEPLHPMKDSNSRRKGEDHTHTNVLWPERFYFQRGVVLQGIVIHNTEPDIRYIITVQYRPYPLPHYY